MARGQVFFGGIVCRKVMRLFVVLTLAGYVVSEV